MNLLNLFRQNLADIRDGSVTMVQEAGRTVRRWVRIGAFLAAGVTAAWVGGHAAWHFGMKDDVRFAVIHKERVNMDGGGSKYLIYTERPGADGKVRDETFEVTDTWWGLRWDSSEFYGRLQPGHSYETSVTGLRSKWFSLYRNVLTANETEPLAGISAAPRPTASAPRPG